MTITEREHESKNYIISLNSEKGRNGFYYRVTVFEKIYTRNGEYYLGFPMREMHYGLNEKEKAQATFRRYRKKYV